MQKCYGALLRVVVVVVVAAVFVDCTLSKALALAGNALGRKGWRSMTSGLALNRTLVTLDVSQCDLDRYSVGLLCTAALSSGVVERLSLRGNSLGGDATKAVCALLEQSRSLLHLDIAETHLQSRDAIALAEAVARAPTLVALNLSRSHLTAADMTFLADAVASNAQLHRLVLDGNALRDDGAAMLCAGVARSRSLQHLSLQQCRLTDNFSVHVVALGRANGHVRYVDLQENDVAERALMARTIGRFPALAHVTL